MCVMCIDSGADIDAYFNTSARITLLPNANSTTIIRNMNTNIIETITIANTNYTFSKTYANTNSPP